MTYSWPGNVRELKSAFEYAFVTCQQSTIQPYHFPPDIYQGPKSSKTRKKASINREALKKKQLIDALEQTGGNQSRAAQILGVSRVTVWNRMKRYRITARRRINS